MTFHMDLTRDCLSSWIHIRILEALMEKPRAMSQRQLGRILGIPKSTIHRVLMDLGQTGLIAPQRVGNATFWDFNRESYLYEALTPILGGLKGLMPPLSYFKGLVRHTMKLKKGSRCILFGSAAIGRDKPESDIDLCLLLPDKASGQSPQLLKQVEDLREKCRFKFGKQLNTLVFSETEFSRHPDKELNRNILKGVDLL